MVKKKQHVGESSGSTSRKGEKPAKQSRCGRVIKNPLGIEDFMVGAKAKYRRQQHLKHKKSTLNVSVKCEGKEVAAKSDQVDPDKAAFDAVLATYEISESDRAKLALADLRNGKIKTVTEAANFWKVNRRPLYRRYNGDCIQDRRGGPTAMSAEDEQKVADWVSRVRRQGFDIKPAMVRNIIPTLFNKKNKNPFIRKRPSGRWFQKFLNRHFKTTYFQKLEMSKVRALCEADVTKEAITKWFSEFHSYLSDLDLLDKPDSIWHYSEIPLQFERTSAHSDNDFIVSIGIGVNASGLVLPPFFIYKEGKRIQVPSDWDPLAGAPSGSRAFILANRGDTRELHQDWIQNLFTPQIEKDDPVVLLMNCGHMGINYNTHLTTFQNNIHLFRLLPKARSLFYPLDVEDDSDTSFKTRFLHKLTETSYMNDIPLNLKNTPRLIKCLWESSVRPQEIQSYFAFSGIYPLDRSMVDDKRLDSLEEVCEQLEPDMKRWVPRAPSRETPPKSQERVPQSPQVETPDESTELLMFQETPQARDPKINDWELSRLLFLRLDSKLDKPTKKMYRKCLKSEHDIKQAPVYDLWKELYTEGFQTELTEQLEVMNQDHSYIREEIVSPCSSPQSPSGQACKESASADLATGKTICPLCEEQYTDGLDEWVQCSGTCQRWFHISCLPAELVTPLILEDKDMYCPQCYS